ncbi:patatin-like phospholipase family protein [Elizabethkingia anophelis]|uniref:patatin-like phospholipase family protein n=1 Tax=Elizabethkingia anophelis TaxID=1117645 RepID=UPI00099A8BE3|nr:patatin-like phospholipase family protein [Elizabethkingia anophelis]MCT3720789.1 patatin-like phospholipase family protein [Elizabethkingia anophelis]MCT3724065.1 patatin-like phospholipase family protein [Elizabethkingia anophelis]MCT3756519.1 patatin-like phospholipase family protein [Elizabethkingia anophelis]MCT3777238.1 patatin-like phospholipase family protein [Elizabethkingia anophelis]MCT3784351.1 patatin-like phospholipase family protein [Elizabethkingia anophelis]
MKRLLLLLIIVFSYAVKSQQKNDSLNTALHNITKDTKFGLALSGGGAKGFAHLGILKMIDSLGIKIDYITGTSMGGILGGLYAMGYNADQLKETVYKVHWHRILSNKIPYNKINISEKDEYDKYILEFPVVKGFPTLPSSYIEGQYMGEVLNTLTFNAKHINDFSKLRIPVELTSSDIENGGLVMQKKGSLPLAIRSTLAIPAAFAPVYIDGKLLVDGGLDRNFPANEVREMGADFVVGGYTGFRLFTKKEIENPMKMIYQTHAIRSVEDFKHQKALSNIMVDFVKPLGDITTKDFAKYDEIIKIGEKEAKRHLPEFVALAEAQRRLGIKYEHKMIEEVKLPTTLFTFSEEDGTPITDADEIENIRKQMELKEGNYYDAKTVNEAIDRVFGMRHYEKVYYTYTNTGDALTMNIFVKRAKKGAFKLALHYDNEQSVGIILNYTYRNFVFSKSRLLVTLDASERFKARIDYQKFLDNGHRWWLNLEGKMAYLRSNDLTFRWLGAINNDDNIRFPNYMYRNITGKIALNYNIHPNAFISFGTEFSAERINRFLEKVDQIIVDNYSKKLYSHSNFNTFLNFEQNNLNKRYFSTKGNHLQLSTRFYYGDQYDLYDLAKVQPELNSILDPKSENYRKTQNIVSFTLNENYSQPVTKRLTAKINLFLGASIGKETDQNRKPNTEQYPYLFLNQKYNLGGSEYNYDIMNPEFNGFRQKELPITSVAKAGLSLQYRIMKKLYLTPSFSYSILSDELSPFKNNINMIGYGLNLGYESLLGPININVSKNDFLDIWRVYFSIGFKF